MTTDPAHESLDRDRLAAATDLPGLRIEVLDTATSTNRLLAERARAGEPAGLVLVADEQTAGRGRLDRSWVTPAGSAVTFSVLLRPDAPAAQWPWLPLLVGLAVRAAAPRYDVDAQLKWPNDVLVGERKIAGILVERVDSPAGPAAVVGVGVNTGLTEEQLPVPEATSLYLETGQRPDRTAVLLDVLRALATMYDAWPGNAPQLADAYRHACDTIGRQVRVSLPSGEALEGEARDIDDSGRLVVATGDGEQAVAAGDVVHVRPSP